MQESSRASQDSTKTVLATDQRLSQSLLWQLQRQFFEQQGVKAWNTGKVPHYITSNPFIAGAYGKVVRSFLQDWLDPGEVEPGKSKSGFSQVGLDLSCPVYILELGAGSGRFAYHFLKQFFKFDSDSSDEKISIKYVMTDLALDNLDFWQTHPSLKPFIEQGVLDFAQFDIVSQAPIHLIQSQDVLSTDMLKNPLIVFANYFFDSIPQDMFGIRDGQLYESLVTVAAPEETSNSTPDTLLENLEITYHDRPTSSSYYDNPVFNQLLQDYQQHLDNTNFLLPIVGLNHLDYLRLLTGDRLLLLTADKGYSQEIDLQRQPKPKLAFHKGCFSLSVNYHAIAQYVQSKGGQALTPQHLPFSLQVCAFLFGQAQVYGKTRLAYDHTIQHYGPDGFFNLKKIVEQQYQTLSLRQLLSYLRFSHWDHNIFLGCWSALMAQVDTLSEVLRQELYQVIQNIWDMYYWIGEDQDLPLCLSQVLGKAGYFTEAIEYLNHSLQLYGESVDKLLQLTTYHLRLGQKAEGLTVLDRALILHPDLAVAQDLRQALQGEGGIVRDVVFDQFNAVAFQGTRHNLAATSTGHDSLSLGLLGLRQCLAYYLQGKSLPSLETVLKVQPDSLEILGDRLGLSAFDRAILLLCLGVEIEPQLRSLCAQAHGDVQKAHATLGLALAALPQADWSVLSPQNPLHHWHLVELESGPGLTQAPLMLDRRILCYLLNESALTTPLVDVITPISPVDIDHLPQSYQTTARQLSTTWSQATGQPFPLICLNGTEGTATKMVVAAACTFLGFQLMALPTTLLPTNPQDLKNLQRHWEREAILSSSVLLLEDDTGSVGVDPGRETTIALFLETSTTPVILSSRDRKPPLQRPIITFDVPPLTYVEQKALWQAHLELPPEQLDEAIDRLTNQFQLSPTAIQSVCLQVSPQFADDGQTPDTVTPKSSGPSPRVAEPLQVPWVEQMWNLCRVQARPRLDDLAHRIEAKATWDELILPDRQRHILRDMSIHLHHRSRVYQDWGFAAKGDRGLGISALFHGESGTGKTMAAEVLAQDCQLDLYRIDLSTVVNKYIGETEKNLRRIFDAAEAGGVILLFDEADALFGKRSEVKDSHDRHANIEVGYLLQRMEAYRGLAILTTNMKDSLDQAFLRRLRFMVPFPFPDAQARAQIWQHIFPPQTPQQNLDYDKLGQLKVSGGNIRNIALNAAFLAAAEDESVQMRHVLRSAQREYLKLEKLLTNEETKGWTLN